MVSKDLYTVRITSTQLGENSTCIVLYSFGPFGLGPNKAHGRSS